MLKGLGEYVDDRQPRRVLHVAFRRSDHSHARIRAIDCSTALAAPGVLAVLTAEDLEGLVKPLLATSRMAGYYATPILPLARDKVRYVGEPVVGTLAESRYQAEDAQRRIAIAFESLPAVSDPEHAARRDAPMLHEQAGTNVLLHREFKRGDADAAMESAPAAKISDACSSLMPPIATSGISPTRFFHSVIFGMPWGAKRIDFSVVGKIGPSAT